MSDALVQMSARTIDLAAVMRRHAVFRPRSPVLTAGRRPAAAVSEESEDAYQRGLAEGQALAAISHDIERQSLLNLLASAEALQIQPCPQLGDLMAAAVEQLVLQIVGDLPVDRAWLQDRVAEASAIIADADRDCTLHLNPADIASIGDTEFALPVRADPQIPRGGLRIAAGDGWVEHGRPVYFDALRKALRSGEAAQ